MRSAHLFLCLAIITSSCRPHNKDSASTLREDTVFTQGPVDLTTFKIDTQEEQKNYQLFEAELKRNNISYESMASMSDVLALNAPAEIKTLISSGVIDRHELAALLYYTTGAYQTLNVPLRNADTSQLKTWAYTIKVASSGLNKIPGKPCIAKRGTGLPPEILKKLQPAARFREKAFLSTTVGKIPTQFVKAVEMEIHSANCRGIAWVSYYPNEKEVLFPPGSEFTVTSNTACKRGDRERCLVLEHQAGTTVAVDNINTGDSNSDPSPGTKGIDKIFRESDFTRKKFISEKGAGKYVYFETTRKGVWLNTQGENTIHDWVLDKESNIIEIKYSRPNERTQNKAYFFVHSDKRVSYLKGPASDKVEEYYDVQ